MAKSLKFLGAGRCRRRRRNALALSGVEGFGLIQEYCTMSIFIYIFNRLFYRFLEFFRHWYLNSFRVFGRFIVFLFGKLERRFALRVTLKHFFEPLYQDRSLIGYILGFIFRTGRLIFGGVIYLILLAMAVFIYSIWLAIPIFIIFKIVSALIK